MKILFIKNSLALVIFAFFMITGCSCFAENNIPYIVDATVEMKESSPEYEICGLDLYFLNKSESDVESFTISFFLFDKDGNPISTGKSNIVLTIEKQIEKEKPFTTCISLDKYFNVVPDEIYGIDYLYVSRIEYSDGSVWSDPFGMKRF